MGWPYAARILRAPCTRAYVAIIFSHDSEQAFREMFEMTLREQLESDLSGDFKTFMVYTQMGTQEFDALLMKKAMCVREN